MIYGGWLVEAGSTSQLAMSVTLEIFNRNSTFGADSRFIISELGLKMLSCHQSLETPKDIEEYSKPVLEASKPHWDCDRHELIVSGSVVKRFRWPAANQETILGVFEEEHWPSRIDDPLPRTNGLDPKRRLADTIKCLNRNQHSNLLKFRGDGTGEGVLWDILSKRSIRGDSKRKLRKQRSG